jgi:hypothetical protein
MDGIREQNNLFCCSWSPIMEEFPRRLVIKEGDRVAIYDTGNFQCRPNAKFTRL